MEHIHEPSDDSYCTTDEDKRDINEEQDEPPIPITEKEGDIIKIKEDNIIKIIEKVGTSLYKPTEYDNCVIESNCFYNDINDNLKEIPVPILCNLDGKSEINLKDEHLPRSFSYALTDLRIDECCLIKIKFKYIFKFFEIDSKKNKFFEGKVPKEFLDKEFIKQYTNEKICFRVKLVNFFTIKNLMDKGEIQAKILKRAPEIKFNYPKIGDDVKYNMKFIYKEKEIYNKENVTSEIDGQGDESKLFEIEKRLLQNTRKGEISLITVQQSFMKDRNKKFIEYYKIDNEQPLFFYVEVIEIQHYKFVYDINKDKYSKTKILYNGFGLDCPDREMLVKLKLQIKLNGEIKFNTFENKDINEYIKENKYTEELKEWRDNMNKKYDIKNIDEEVDFSKSKQIFEELNFLNLLNIDMKMYTIPNLLRKVLVHMKRNEIIYIRTTFIDYFNINNCKLYSIGKFGKNEGTLIEMYVHLYEFQQLPTFGRYPYTDKYSQMLLYKKEADECFKSNDIYRAMKIYHNLNYRFDEGDIFGNDPENSQKHLMESDKELYDKLIKMNIGVHNNYALCKLKLGRIYTCYETAKKVVKSFDDKNPKALYLLGKTSLMLKFYKESVETLRKLKEIQPNNPEVEELLNEAEKANNDDLNKEKKMFKKMFKYSD